MKKIFSPNASTVDQLDQTLFYGFITSRILKNSQIDLGGTAVPLPTIALSGRLTFFLFNNSGNIVYLGNSSVSTANGFPVYPRSGINITIEDQVTIYGISAGASSDIRILEGS